MFFIEGYETSSVVLTNVLYQLAVHRDVQKKIRNEIDDTLKKGELTFEAVGDMNYLNAVLSGNICNIKISSNVINFYSLCRNK